MNDATKFCLTFLIGLAAVGAFLEYGMRHHAQENPQPIVQAPPPQDPPPPVQVQAPVTWSDLNAQQAQQRDLEAERLAARHDAIERERQARADAELALKIQMANQLNAEAAARDAANNAAAEDYFRRHPRGGPTVISGGTAKRVTRQ